MTSTYDLDASDEDSADRQLLAEFEATPSAQPSAVISAGLLNAARAGTRGAPLNAPQSSPVTERLRTLALSSPGGKASRKGKAGKLKRPSFMSANLAKVAAEKNRKRRNVYDIDVSPQKEDPEAIPTKGSSVPLEPTVKKRGRPAKKTRAKAPSDAITSSPLALEKEPQSEIGHEQNTEAELEDFRQEWREEVSAKTKGKGPASATLSKTTQKSPSRTHVSTTKVPILADDTSLRPTITEQLTDSPTRKSDRIAGEEAQIANVAWEKKPEAKAPTTRKRKRVSQDEQAEEERPRESPRTDSPPMSTAIEEESPAPKPRRTRAQSRNTHPQVVIPATRAPKRTKLAQVRAKNLNVAPTTQHARQPRKEATASTSEDIFEFHGSDEVEEVVTENAPTAAGHQEDPVPDKSVQSPVRSKAKRAKAKPAHSVPESSRTYRRPRVAASQKSTDPSVPKAANPTENAGTTTEEIIQPEVDIQVDDVEVAQGPQEDAEEIASEERQVEEEGDEDSDEDADEENERGEPAEVTGIPEWDRIFWFAKVGRREGRCQTKDAKRIGDACTKASELIFDSSSTLQEVTDTVKPIRSLLRNISDYDDSDDQKAFKADAFGHLFARLARLLEASYSWTKEHYENPLSSVAALRIVHPLMRSILTFKNTITSWHVKIGQRYKGDVIIKDVEQNFIVPLRKIEGKFAIELKQVEQQEKVKKIREEAAARRREQEEEDRLREEREKSSAKRRNAWQSLHICRLECESSLDPRRRRHLRFRKIEDMEERDANGVRFEREPIFRDRETPFAHRASPFEGDEWSDKQLEALIEGLQRYRGERHIRVQIANHLMCDPGPRVFERIFQRYCRPGGVLRNFNVSEITAQAAYVRFKTMETFQSEGWEVEEWVKQIPVLP
jgi:hypothetical protein